MKHQLFLTFLVFIGHVSFAQDDLKLVKDGATMRDGKLFKIDKEGNLSPATADIDFGNGTRISRNGDLTWNGGTKTKLREGEVVLRSGFIGIVQSRIKQLSGYIRKDGRMLEILPVDLKSFEGEKTIADSNRLTSDGKYYIGKSGKYIQIAEHEVVTASGEVFLNVDEASTTESYVAKRDAVVIKAVNNKMAIVDAEYLFPNGTKVSPQGLVTTKEGMSFNLKSGEKLNSKGELFLNNDGLFSNGLVKKDGLVFEVREGKVSQVNEEYVKDSVRISPKGIITYGNKPEKFVMKDGDVVSLEGVVMVSSAGCSDAGKSKKDRFIIDHVMYKEGKLFIIKDAESSLLQKEIVLNDGSKILKTGHIIKPNGSKIQLRDGQRIAITGEELPDEKPEETVNPDKNYITMRNGRMWVVTEGKPGLMKEDYNIKGRMIIKPDGYVAKSDGSKLQFKENDRMSFDGVMIPLDKRPQAGMMPSEYYIMKMGKMWVVRDGKPSKIESDVLTNDGTKILMDGTVVKKDRTRFQLKENDKIDSKGELITGR